MDCWCLGQRAGTPGLVRAVAHDTIPGWSGSGLLAPLLWVPDYPFFSMIPGTRIRPSSLQNRPEDGVTVSKIVGATGDNPHTLLIPASPPPPWRCRGKYFRGAVECRSSNRPPGRSTSRRYPAGPVHDRACWAADHFARPRSSRSGSVRMFRRRVTAWSKASSATKTRRDPSTRRTDP